MDEFFLILLLQQQRVLWQRMHMVRDTSITEKEIRQVRFPGLVANAQRLGVTMQTVRRDVQRPRRVSTVSYAWRQGKGEDTAGRALKWWLQQLKSPATRAALLSQARRKRTKGVES